MSSFSSILLRIAKDAQNARMGRIWTYPARWIFSEQVRKNHDVVLGPRQDADGRAIVLVGGRCTTCPNPCWQGKYARTEEGERSSYWVPLSACRACDHYSPRRRKPRGMFCTFKATANSVVEANMQAVGDVEKVVESAHAFARNIIGQPTRPTPAPNEEEE
jgi:hypothetical protein